MTARLYRGDEDQCDARESRETRHRLGAHHDEGAGPGQPTRRWPAWSMSQTEQPPYRSALAAARWAEDHAEDDHLSRDDPWGDDAA